MTDDNRPEALDAFRRACQEYVVFYGFVCDGMPSFRCFIEQLMIRHSAGRSDPYRIGVVDPVSGLYPASLPLGEVLDRSDRNGDFHNLIGKLTIVAIFSIWEDFYRDKIAEELKLEKQRQKERKNRITSELMGDIRHIRICIVHKNSILSNESSRFTVLNPQHFPEGPLQLTRAVMTDIMHSINEMNISVKPDG